MNSSPRRPTLIFSRAGNGETWLRSWVVEILPYLVRLRDEANIPMVYVSHDAAELRQLATQIVVLRGGRVISIGGVKVPGARD